MTKFHNKISYTEGNNVNSKEVEQDKEVVARPTSSPTKQKDSDKPTNTNLLFRIGGNAVKVSIPKSTHIYHKVKWLNHLTAKGIPNSVVFGDFW